METYHVFNQRKTKQLWLKRIGWIKPVYELTDGAFSYGSLSYYGFINRVTQLETANEGWMIRNAGFFKMEISTADGRVAGYIKRNWLSSKIEFIGADGFSALYYRLSIWRSEFVWVINEDQTLIHIDSGGLMGKIVVTFADFAYEQPYLLLLALLSLDFDLTRRRHIAV